MELPVSSLNNFLLSQCTPLEGGSGFSNVEGYGYANVKRFAFGMPNQIDHGAACFLTQMCEILNRCGQIERMKVKWQLQAIKPRHGNIFRNMNSALFHQQ